MTDLACRPRPPRPHVRPACGVHRRAAALVLGATLVLAGCGDVSTPAAQDGRGASSPGSTASPAGGPQDGCLLLVTEISPSPVSGGPTTGGFLVLQFKDGLVAGEGGDFFSEGFDVRGEFDAQGVELQMRVLDASPWEAMPLVWDSEQGTFEGWEAVDVEQMRMYSDGYVPRPGSVCAGPDDPA